MIDVLFAILGFLHLAALVGLIVLYCRHMKLPWREWPLFVYLILWASLVAAGYLLSIFDALDNLPAYVLANFTGLGMVLLVHRSLMQAAPLKTPYAKITYPVFTEIVSPQTRKFLFYLLLGTLAVELLVHLIIGFSFYPVNADSLNYRLPRVFWYVSHGNLLHPFESLDKRLDFYPVDGILLYTPLVLYGVSSIFFAVPSVLSWVAITYVTYRFARALQADRLIALFAAWLVAMMPDILVEASSTNDEILTATSLVIGIYFAWRWLTTGAGHYFFLFALGIGLCIGVKLHIFFLLPIMAGALLWFLWFLYRRKESWRQWLPALRRPALFWSLCAVGLMGVMFLLLNYISSGRFYFLKESTGEVLNLGASLQDALQNLVIYISSMILAPIADLNIFESFHGRELTNAALNNFFMPLAAPFVDTNPKYFHLKYVFHGVIIPTSVLLVEYGLWPGFMWMLWPVQVAAFMREAFTLRRFFMVLAAVPAVWLIIWSCITLYMEGVPTYFAFYWMCAAPAMALVFTRARTPRGDTLRWWAIAFVLFTNIVIDGNVAINNTFRGLWHFTEDQPFPYDWLRFEKPVIDELQRAKKIQIAITHGKVYYFAFMHWNPNAFYYGPYQPTPPDPSILHVLSTPSEFSYGFMPLKIAGKLTPGITYLGHIRGVDREAIFAFGNNVASRHPADSTFISLHMNIRPREQGHTISVDPGVAGLNPQDQLEFQYTLMTIDKKIIGTRAWDPNPAVSFEVSDDPEKVRDLLKISVRSALDYSKNVSQIFPTGGKGAWCIQESSEPCSPDDDDEIVDGFALIAPAPAVK